MELVNFRELNKSQLLQAAQILTASLPLGWADLMEAEAEIKKRFIPENVLLAAVEGETILGWGGALPEYDGNVWELHPLAVRGGFPPERHWPRHRVGSGSGSGKAGRAYDVVGSRRRKRWRRNQLGQYRPFRWAAEKNSRLSARQASDGFL